VPKVTEKVKRPLPKSPRKKASAKTTIPMEKNKKARGITLFGHYHRLNKKLSNDEPDKDRDSMENSSILCNNLKSP
jgi:hypothetical protein